MGLRRAGSETLAPIQTDDEDGVPPAMSDGEIRERGGRRGFGGDFERKFGQIGANAFNQQVSRDRIGNDRGAEPAGAIAQETDQIPQLVGLK